MDRPAHQRNTSSIYDPEMMQYSIANTAYPINNAKKMDKAGLRACLHSGLIKNINKDVIKATTPPVMPQPKDIFLALDTFLAFSLSAVSLRCLLRRFKQER